MQGLPLQWEINDSTLLLISRWAGLVFNTPTSPQQKVNKGYCWEAEGMLIPGSMLPSDLICYAHLCNSGSWRDWFLSCVKSDWCSTCVIRLSSDPFIYFFLTSCWFCTPGWIASTQPLDYIFHSCFFSNCVSKWSFLALVLSNTPWALHCWPVTLPAPS